MLNFWKFVPLLAIALAFVVLPVQGQVDAFTTVSIAAPTAASLGKYVDYPVNYHTGVPEISFPIYTIKEGTLELPISLSYHASGLKVMEYSSWLGAGFALNAGGMITRAVRGFPDEIARSDGKSYLNQKGYYNYLYAPNVTSPTLDYLGFMEARRDGEPDLFFFNFNGYSGKFYFRADGTPVLVPASDIRIAPQFCTGGSPTGCNSSQGYLYGWVVTTPDGVKYYFGKTASDGFNGGAVEVNQTYSPSKGLSDAVTYSSWYLYKMESADGRYHIDLSYAPEKYANYSIATFSRTVGYDGNSNTSGIELVKNYVRGIRLSSITFSGKTISFNPEETARQDLSRYDLADNLKDYDNTEAKALKSIVVDDGDLCKRYDFSYTYFSNTIPLASNYGTETPAFESLNNLHTSKKRLRLDSFREMFCDGDEKMPAHIFSYYAGTVPATISLAQDHWGFYNGMDGNVGLIPFVYTDGQTNGSPAIGGSSAIRNSYWPAMRAGTLKSIKYPTGGNTEFIYGHHGLYVGSTIKIVGGLRVDTIKTWTAPGKPAKAVTYQYINSGVVQGVLYSRPNYIALIRNSWLGESGVPKSSSPTNTNFWTFDNGCIIPNNVGNKVIYAVSPGSIHPMQTSQGNHFGYNEVKVVQADGGYTIYKYTPGENPTGGDVSVRSVNVEACNNQAPNYPPVPPPNDFMRGVQRGVVTFNAAGQKLTERFIDPIYTEETVGVTGFIVTPSAYPMAAEYEMKTAKKTFERSIELTYTPGQAGTDATPFGLVREDFFESIYHTGITRSVVYEVAKYQDNVLVKGEALKEERYQYSGDFKTPSVQAGVPFCEDIAYTCDQQLITAINQERTSYLAAMTACGANQACRYNRWQLYMRNVNDLRKTYVNTCRASYLAARKSCEQNTQAYTSASADLQALIDLKNQNRYHSLVETSSWRKGKFLGSSYVTYKTFDANRIRIYPVRREVLEVAVPIAIFSPAVNAGNAIVKTPAYRMLDTCIYQSGNLAEVRSTSMGSTSYMWGYGDRYPILKASYARIVQLYYNGFELSGSTGDAAAGTYYYNSGNFTIPFTPPTDGHVYKMSYWYWDSGAWKFSGELPFASTISRGSRLDEIRVYPAGAQVTSYAYSEGRGITSSVDANGQRTFYNYDDFGRLINVKDNNGDVVNRYNYSYYVKQLED